MTHAARLALAAAVLAMAGCEQTIRPELAPLPALPDATTAATPRVSGLVGSTDRTPPPQILYGRGPTVAAPNAPAAPAGGDISVDFVDTDIREIVSQVLGTLLGLNYTIDPAVRGTATLRTVNPVARSQLLPALQAVLSQNGAAIVQSGGLTRVVPAAAAAASATLAGGDAVSGSAVIPLRYAAAEDLARVLQPFVGAGGRIVPDPSRNVLLVSGDPATRETLVSLIRSFDVNALAGQSYALFPVQSGTARDLAAALTDAMRSQTGGALAGVVRVAPLERNNSVLVVSSQPRYIDDARRIYALVERNRRTNVRSWAVHYLQNSRSNDIAYVLQQAFTPRNVTAQPSARGIGATAPGRNVRRSGGGGGFGGSGGSGGSGGLGSGNRGGGLGGGGGGLGGSSGLGGSLGATQAGGLGGAQPGGAAAPPGGDPAQTAANPLFGGLDPGAGGGGGTGGEADTDTIRIIPNSANNAILLYATPQERDTIEAMLRKIDILPLQVRIDATIAEVTLNDRLSYGTQFFFKSGGINGALSFGTTAAGFATGFPGFVLSGHNNGNAALAALQAVTSVKVLSSPQLLVLDNEAARLQVGNLVPFLTASSQSIIAPNAPIVNSIDYRETGVIMEVTPRVNSGGLVTLDISQEVSDVDTAVVTPGINSPTFLQRNVSSRVVVQDGQTVGLAGLIRDSTGRANRGIPFLKDIPLLGLLAGGQDNARTRTELIVLITPHVLQDQRDARALTEDLRQQMFNAASVPDELQRLGPSGSVDPSAPLRRTLRLER